MRQAINYALNQQEIIDVVLEGRDQVANSVMNVNIPGYSEEITGYSQDLEKAKALMAEAGYPDASIFPLFHTKNFGATGNRAFYSNPEVDTLIEQAQKESDNAKRMELYKEIQQKINDDAPWACLFYGTTCTGIRADLKGFVLHPSSANHYENLYYEK